MLVVSDTSPLRALHMLGLVPILNDLYSEIAIPPTVAAELANPPIGLIQVNVHEFSFIRVLEPHRLLSFDAELDAGELEAISLAQEIRAEWLLIDEAMGRQVARELGMRIVGVLGILEAAKYRGLIPRLRPLINKLTSQGRFFLSQQLILEVLSRAGEANR